jgi:hypothetical protein
MTALRRAKNSFTVAGVPGCLTSLQKSTCSYGDRKNMPQLDVAMRELAILEFVLTDLAEAIEDGDRPEFSPGEVNGLINKVLVAQQKSQRE